MLLNDKNQLSMFFFLLVLLGTTFYFFPSGYPQPGHVLLGVLILVALPNWRYISFQAPEKLLVAFWLYAALVNSVFWWTYRDAGFIVSTAYWTFGLAILFSLRQIYLTKPNQSAVLIWALLITIIIQVVVFVIGDQRVFFDKRFMGTFNDPNQFSYWLLCMFVGAVLARGKPKWLNALSSLAIFLLLACLLVLSTSRSAMLGMGVLLIGLLWWLLLTLREHGDGTGSGDRASPFFSSENKHSGKRLFLVVLGIILAGFIVLGGIIWGLFNFSLAANEVINDLIRRTLAQDMYSQLQARGYTHLINYAQYLLFGAGQGHDIRFRELTDGAYHEVHSSFASPLFYYGVIGFGLLYGALFQLARDRLKGWQWLVFAAPFVYGLTTYGLRTPVFWIMLASLYTIPPKQSSDKVDPEF